MRKTSPQLVIGHRMLIEYEVNLTVPLANGKYCCLNLGHSFGIMFQQLNIDFGNRINFDFVSLRKLMKGLMFTNYVTRLELSVCRKLLF